MKRETKAIRDRTIERLAQLGITPDSTRLKCLVRAVAEARKDEHAPRSLNAEVQAGYLDRWLKEDARERGLLVGPQYRPPFRKYRPKRHLREAEIDAQPKRISMPWDGTGASRQWRGW